MELSYLAVWVAEHHKHTKVQTPIENHWIRASDLNVQEYNMSASLLYMHRF